MDLINNMKSKINYFYTDSCVFLSGIIESMDYLSYELSHMCVRDYYDKFINARDLINSVIEEIRKFLDKWKDDDEDRILETFKTIKEYYGFYHVTLSNSSPNMFCKDSKYIVDSIGTARQILLLRLKKAMNKV